MCDLKQKLTLKVTPKQLAGVLIVWSVKIVVCGQIIWLMSAIIILLQLLTSSCLTFPPIEASQCRFWVTLSSSHSGPQWTQQSPPGQIKLYPYCILPCLILLFSLFSTLCLSLERCSINTNVWFIIYYITMSFLERGSLLPNTPPWLQTDEEVVTVVLSRQVKVKQGRGTGVEVQHLRFC